MYAGTPLQTSPRVVTGGSPSSAARRSQGLPAELLARRGAAQRLAAEAGTLRG